MPLAPGLGRREHAAAAAHVAEGALARAVRTATGDAGNTRHGAAGTPGLGGGLVTGLVEHGVRLAVVFLVVLGFWGMIAETRGG